MAIVTFTTDFGLQDYSRAWLVGALLQQDPALTVVDISHNIRHFDIVQAAFIFKHAWQAFPAGTVHIITVNDQPQATREWIILHWQEHYFLAPNNGLFSLVFSETNLPCYRLPVPQEGPFSLPKLLAYALGHLQQGKPLEAIGEPLEERVQRFTIQPVTGPDYIRGTVIYVDGYENVVINIHRELFDRIGQQRPFALFFKRHDPITRLSQDYGDVPVGETLCLFNTADMLEIAIHMGRASSLLSLQVDDTIQVNFQDQPQPPAAAD